MLLASAKETAKENWNRYCVAYGSVAYSTNPTEPVGDWKEAWEAARKRAGVTCRFHDLRHTGCTRMLEAGVPFSVVSDIMGWSASTAVCMAKRYGHIGHSARREAVDKLSNATILMLRGHKSGHNGGRG